MMKITETGIKMNVNQSTSFIIFVGANSSDVWAAAEMMYKGMKIAAGDNNDWELHLTGHKVMKCCTVPSVFHNETNYMATITHNNGSWTNGKEPTYCLYIVD